jgi:hypothetical protein
VQLPRRAGVVGVALSVWVRWWLLIGVIGIFGSVSGPVTS